MSFSWSITNETRKDLLSEFAINGQAFGLGGDGEDIPHSTQAIRSAFAEVPYKEKLQDAAQDAVKLVQSMVADNLRWAKAGKHPECPCCKCPREQRSGVFFGFDIEAAERFVSIPLERVHRASGGW